MIIALYILYIILYIYISFNINIYLYIYNRIGVLYDNDLIIYNIYIYYILGLGTYILYI